MGCRHVAQRSFISRLAPPAQIPADQEPRLRASPRACAVAYPTREAHGLLWVFASPDDAAVRVLSLTSVAATAAFSL